MNLFSHFKKTWVFLAMFLAGFTLLQAQPFYVGERGASVLSSISSDGTRTVVDSINEADGVLFLDETTIVVSSWSPIGGDVVKVNLMTGDTTHIAALGGDCQGMTLDAQGNLLVVNETLGKVEKVDMGTYAVTDVATGLNRPIDVLIGNGDTILITLYNDGEIIKYNTLDHTSIVFATGMFGPTDMYQEEDGNILVAENAGSGDLSRIDGNTGARSVVASLGGFPHGIVKDADGNIYCTRWTGNDIVKIDTAGQVTTFATGLVAPTFIVERSVSAASLSFDGIDDHVVLPVDFGKNFTNGTVSGAAWVYLDTADVWGTIIKNWGNSNWGSFHFGIENDSMELAIEIWDGVNPRIFVISPDTFPVQQWVHAAFTADGDSIRLYENGVQKASAAYSGQLHTDFPATYIGAKPNDAGDGVDPFNPGYWDGRIDELSMWDRGLSPAEVRALADCKPMPNQSGLVAYYSFDQGLVDANNANDTILIDDVSSMYNGELMNFALTGTSSNWAEGNKLAECPELVNASTLNFDGINDHIVLPDSFGKNFTNGIISGAAWAYLDTTSVWGTIIKNWGNSNWGSFHFGLENDSMEMAIEIWDGSSPRLFVISPDSFPIRQWVHVAFVADGDSVRLFEDGIQKAVSPYSGQLFTDFPATYIGAKPNDAGDGVDPFNPGYWNGDLDDISMWNRALTVEEIENLANCKPMVDEDGLVAYYGFDQGLVDFNNEGDTILYDDKGMYNGVLMNFALDGAVSNWTGDGEILDDCFVSSPPLSIEDYFSTETGLTIAPNPAIDVLNLQLEVKKNAEMTIYVFDLSGRMIMSKAEKVVRGPQELRIDIDNLSSGIYFLTVQIGEDHYSKKFVKSNW